MPACLTVDVEDWYQGMADLGHPVRRPVAAGNGLDALLRLLRSVPGSADARLTLFVVGTYAAQVATQLGELAAQGHEMASHGLEHRPLPEDARRLREWLRAGREAVEDVVQRPVSGFRSPRFAAPRSIGLEHYREVIAEAGFGYVSDRHRVGAPSPVHELPVLEWRRIPLGGGSYQRLFPTSAVRALVQRRGVEAPVLYYHSYDFGGVLPTIREDHSRQVLRYSLGRRRAETIFRSVLATAGSVSCQEVLDVV